MGCVMEKREPEMRFGMALYGKSSKMRREMSEIVQ